ncbi:hypothetical protein NON20_24620 (plasmid) [Synechocystis sp. B12]|nr:hypothetical protein NON20_24620 [Synechocystis sp. B12]
MIYYQPIFNYAENRQSLLDCGNPDGYPNVEVFGGYERPILYPATLFYFKKIMKQVNFDTQTLADAIFCEIIAELPTRNLTPEVIRGILDGCVSFVGKQQPTQKNAKSPSIPQSIPSPRSIQPIPPKKRH